MQGVITEGRSEEQGPIIQVSLLDDPNIMDLAFAQVSLLGLITSRTRKKVYKGGISFLFPFSKLKEICIFYNTQLWMLPSL